MKSCKDCAFYRANTCHAWLIPTKPEDEPCDKFHGKDERRDGGCDIEEGGK